MDITQIIVVGVATALSVLLLKQMKPELAVIIGLVGSVIIFVMVVSGLSQVVITINKIATDTGIAPEIFSSILKIVGIAYLCEIASGICKDSGAASVSDMIIIGGKVLIMVLAIPIIEGLISVVLGVIA